MSDFSYIFNKDKQSYSVVGYSGSSTEIIIPTVYNGVPVTNIYNRAFFCERITKITIPDSVKHIGNYAFCGCNSLSQVVNFSKITSVSTE